MSVKFSSQIRLKSIHLFLFAIPVVVLISIFLAWISNSYASTAGWFAFAIIISVGFFVFAASWRIIQAEHPIPVIQLIAVGAVLLRITVGVLFYLALPGYGHGTLYENSGYIYADAAKRDLASYELAASDLPLLDAFGFDNKSDQYGGLLFISAVIYRNLAGEIHYPLLIAIFLAFISSAAVFFIWGFVKNRWGDSAALLACGLFAIYPEAVIIAGSQMRESLMIAFTAVAFYGLVRAKDNWKSWNLLLLAVPVFFSLPLSPLYTLLLVSALAITAIPLYFPKNSDSKYKTAWIFIPLVVLLLITDL